MSDRPILEPDPSGPAGPAPLAVLLASLSVVSSGYAGLKELILNKFQDRFPELDSTFAKYEQQPEVWKQSIKDALHEAGVDRDQEVLDRATELLSRAETARPGVTGGLVGQIDAQGGQVVVIGGNQMGTINVSNFYRGELDPKLVRRMVRTLLWMLTVGVALVLGLFAYRLISAPVTMDGDLKVGVAQFDTQGSSALLSYGAQLSSWAGQTLADRYI